MSDVRYVPTSHTITSFVEQGVFAIWPAACLDWLAWPHAVYEAHVQVVRGAWHAWLCIAARVTPWPVHAFEVGMVGNLWAKRR